VASEWDYRCRRSYSVGLVPTLCVVTRVFDALRRGAAVTSWMERDAERPNVRYHAERGNEGNTDLRNAPPSSNR